MWNTVRVANIESMVYDALAFNGDLGGWNTASVTTMRFVFQSSPLIIARVCWRCWGMEHCKHHYFPVNIWQSPGVHG